MNVSIKILLAVLLTGAGLMAARPVRAQAPVCRPFVYETIQGLAPLGSRVTFELFEDGALRERQGTIYAYYWLPCWPGAPVIGLEEVAYVIDYGRLGPAGNRVDVILNRDRFEVRA
jgi:hypothetical protein